jgi:hypothetical protein
LALTTPTIPNILPFPANLDYILNFNVGNNSSDQVVANRIVLQNNSNNAVVYDNEVANFLYTHLIPANTLQNNLQYKIQVYTKNIANNYSTPSDWSLFYCFSPAIVTINNITGGIVNNQNFNFTGSYTQANDLIKSFRFILYDSNGVLLNSYPEVISSNITQLVSNLQNNTSYHIELLTISQSRVQVTTGLIGFTVSYIAPVLDSELTLTNLYNSGSVEVDILAVEVEGVGSNVTYESNDWINIKNSGAYVYFNQRLNLIISDFNLRLHFKNIPSNTVFCTTVGDNGNLTIKYYNNRFHVFKNANGLISHFINNTDITFISTDKICLEIKQINNLIDVTAQIYV